MDWFRYDDPFGQALVVALGAMVGYEVVKRRGLPATLRPGDFH
jgi:hypothetical protein